MSCAIELLDAALARAEGNSYEALLVSDQLGDRAGAGAGDQPLGYVCFGATPMTEATFDVYWIVIAAEARGRGLGRALLDATERQLRERGARTVRVETSSLEGQGGAARFYDRAGYQRSGFIESFYRPGDDLITFTKKLA